MKSLRINIFYKLFISIILLVSSISIILSFWFTVNTQKLVLSELILRSNVLAKSISDSAVKGVETQNVFRSLNPLIQSAMGQKDIVYIHILDASGTVLASSQLETGTNFPKAPTREEDRLEVVSLIFPSATESITTSPTAVSIGSVRLGISLKHFHQNMLTTTLLSLLISGGVLIGGVCVTYVFVRRFSRRIRLLKEATERIESGVLETHVSVTRDDELGDLAITFNKMADALKSSTEEVAREKESLEERIVERTAELTAMNKELETFNYTVSHDLRTPLRAISSYASFLEKDCKEALNAVGQNYLSEIKKSVLRMTRLLDDLLNFSRMARVQNPYTATDMNQLVERIKNQIAADHPEKNMEVEIETYLPTVYCDLIKIEVVFVNLLGNAIKFSEKSGRVPKVNIGYRETENEHEFYVADNGIGVEPKFHAQIFGLFNRLHTEKEYEGTGVGLSIVKRVIEDHKGRIMVESELGKGAKFIFTIPKGQRPPERGT